MKLSVVLCTHNGEEHLAQQLDSLLGQTRLPDEVVIGDDASTDGTWEVVEAFASAARDRGVTVLSVQQLQNLGVVRNFSETLCLARGDVLFLCDQDDVWRADKLADMERRFLVEPELLMLWSDAQLIDERGNDLRGNLFRALGLNDGELRAIHEGRAFDVLLRRSMVTGATAALRRSVLKIGLPVADGWLHDEWLAMVAACSGRIDVLERRLVDYRQHANNQVGMRMRTLADKWRDMVRPRRELLLREVLRLEALAAHLSKLQLGELIRSDCSSQLANKRQHLLERIEIGGCPRWRRMPAVLREARKGNYHRYGTGLRTILRDLLRHD